MLKLIERVSGLGFLEDISEFLLAFEGMSEGFRERARSVERALLGPADRLRARGRAGRRGRRPGRRLLDRLETLRVASRRPAS